jgi:hypothetical protein
VIIHVLTFAGFCMTREILILSWSNVENFPKNNRLSTNLVPLTIYIRYNILRGIWSCGFRQERKVYISCREKRGKNCVKQEQVRKVEQMVRGLMCQLLLWKRLSVDSHESHFQEWDLSNVTTSELVVDCRGGCGHHGGTEG